MPDRALVDALLGLEELPTEVEVERTGQRRDACGSGQGHHVGRCGLGAAGQRGGKVANPGLGGVGERNVVLRDRPESAGRLFR